MKQTDPDKITEINPLIVPIGREEKTKSQLEKIKQHIADHPKPHTIRKDEMTPRDTTSQVPFYQAVAGAKVKDSYTGEDVLTHEYDHKDFHNLIYALCMRQFGCMTQLDGKHVRQFRTMVNKWMDEWVPKFIEKW